jgi:hypothetical protein
MARRQASGQDFKLRYDQVIPVPNFLQDDPEELAEKLEPGQRLVGDLLDDGYTLYRLPAGGPLKKGWEGHLGVNLGTDPLVVLWHHGNDFPGVHMPTYTAPHNPTTVSVAQVIS